jgi:hypothetical protein
MDFVRDSTDAVRELRGVRYNLLRVRITGLLRPAILLKKRQKERKKKNSNLIPGCR